MAMHSFTRNYADNSSEAGFEFTFYCDICGDGYKTRFIEAKSYRKSGFLKNLTEGLSTGARMVGLHELAYGLDRGGDILGQKFEGMSPAWRKEHEAAFAEAMNEAKGHFHRCHGCQRWVCDADFNDDEGLCVECAPRTNTVVAKARSERLVEEVREKAAATSVYKGDISSQQIVCPECGKPVAQGKFCSNCGASVSLLKCSSCGAELQAGAKFCSECGSKVGACICPDCGADNQPGAKFCCECGSRLE